MCSIILTLDVNGSLGMFSENSDTDNHYPFGRRLQFEANSSQQSLCYAKRSPMFWVVVIPKEGRACFFFKMVGDFFLSYQKKGGHGQASFGLTPTQAIRDLFMWLPPNFEANWSQQSICIEAKQTLIRNTASNTRRISCHDSKLTDHQWKIVVSK